MNIIVKNQEEDLEGQEQQSYFYKLYQQKLKEIQGSKSTLSQDLINIQNKSLFEILNEGADEEELQSEQNESYVNQLSSYTELVAKTLNLPYTQVYIQAQTNPLGFQKILEKAKRQIRREKAKSRQKVKTQNCEDPSNKNNLFDLSKTEESEIKSKFGLGSTTHTSSGEDDKPRKKQKQSSDNCQILKVDEEDLTKKQIQMIRNRMSAQNSRDKKKQYVNKMEKDTRRIDEQNRYLRSQVECLSAQVNQFQTHNQELLNQLKEIQDSRSNLNNLICSDCQSRNIVYDCDFYDFQPTLTKRSSGLTKFGLAFLTVLTVFAVVATPSFNGEIIQNTNLNEVQTRQLEQTSLQLWDDTCVPKLIDGVKYLDKVITEDHLEYEILHKISQFQHPNYQKDYLESVDQKIQKIDPIEDQQPLLLKKIRQNKKQAKNQLATLDYFKDQEKQVQTLYCPNSFKYQDFSQSGIKVTFQNNQWIHLLVPKNNITLFYQNLVDQSIMTRERAKQKIQSSKSQISEIWCQIKSVNELLTE